MKIKEKRYVSGHGTERRKSVTLHARRNDKNTRKKKSTAGVSRKQGESAQGDLTHAVVG
jgi:hypothetical protein